MYLEYNSIQFVYFIFTQGITNNRLHYLYIKKNVYGIFLFHWYIHDIIHQDFCVIRGIREGFLAIGHVPRTLWCDDAQSYYP